MKGRLIQHKNDYCYDCTCGGVPEYIESEWKWKCPKCGANNYEKGTVVEIKGKCVTIGGIPEYLASYINQKWECPKCGEIMKKAQ